MSTSNNVSQTTDSTFDQDVLKSPQVALVDFWAEWCGPCRMLAPTIDAIADEYAGKIKVFKVNVDENPEIPTKFHIRGIPTIIIFKNGAAVDQIVGNQPKEVILQAVKKAL